MNEKRSVKIPSYRRHKASGQAIVTIDGQTVYLGEWQSDASRAKYDRTIAKLLEARRKDPAVATRTTPDDLTVNRLILMYWDHAKTYYVKDGKLSSEASSIRQALRYLRNLYGDTLASEFGPLAFKAVRQAMMDHGIRKESGLCRKTINNHGNRIQRMFRWAVENQHLPPNVFHGLQAVPGLRRGRSAARESEAVRPVPERHVDAIRPFVSRQVWGLISLQRLTGMRPGEATILRACDLDMSGRVWLYRPASHKGQHLGHERVVELGPRAKAVIKEFLKADLGAYVVSPKDAQAERNAERRSRLVSPLTPTQRARRPKKNPKRSPGLHYSTASYSAAIVVGCEKANVPAWTAHRLRHNFATMIRKEFGVEPARILLGHKRLSVTEVYAEVNRAAVADIIVQVG